jgi:hypothetical protein
MIRRRVPILPPVTTIVGTRALKSALIASLLLQITAGSISQANLEFEVKERTISRADGTTRPLDLSPETLRRAVRAVEAERAAFYEDQSGRRPGIDGPWASGVERARNARVAALRVVTIDANDKATCRRVAQEIASSQILPARPEDALENLCNDPKRKGNVARIVVMENQDSSEFQVNLDASFLTNTDRTLANDTRNLALGMAGTMGVLWAMPGSFTGWDKEKIRSNPDGIFAEYKDNIKRGPVWDKDKAFFNYVAHPAAGAAYYTLSRHNGKSPLESFGYSVAMSTFFWEYGFEAFAEIPSIQDLIITPVIGAILGEAAYQYEQKIRNDGGRLLGSRAMGSAAMIVLNPAGALSDAINSVLGAKVIKRAKADLVLKRYKPVSHEPGLETMIGIQFNFLF